MQAISIIGPRRVEPVNIPEPQPGPEDVLVEVHYIGLCGSDLNSYRGLLPLVTYPRIPGHEISGVVVGKGPAVPTTIDLQDRVTVSPYTVCGVCPACRAGRPNCCQHNQTYGIQRDGVLTSRFATHFSNIYVNNRLSLPELALVEPLSVGYHAANRGRVSESDTVLVLGCGAIGLGAIAAAARKGATVVALDIDRGKLAVAQKFGAAHTINAAAEDALAAIKRLTNAEGVSVAIEAVGLPLTFRMAVEAAAFAGRVVYIGYAKQEVSFDTTHFVCKELDIMGSRNALRVFPAVIKMLELKQRPFGELISQIYPFAHTAQAFANWEANPGSITKILIDVQAT